MMVDHPRLTKKMKRLCRWQRRTDCATAGELTSAHLEASIMSTSSR
jgi:hypothetical protein